MTEATFAPTVADVASYIRARTKVSGGKEAGTFNDNTRPTATEVENLIEQAVDHVAAAIGGDPCNDQLMQSATRAAALWLVARPRSWSGSRAARSWRGTRARTPLPRRWPFTRGQR